MLLTAENLTNYTSTLSMASGRNKGQREISFSLSSLSLCMYVCVCVSVSLCIYKYCEHGRALFVYASRPMKPFGGGGRGVLDTCLSQFSLSILDVLPPVPPVVAVGVSVGVGVVASALRL